MAELFADDKIGAHDLLEFGEPLSIAFYPDLAAKADMIARMRTLAGPREVSKVRRGADALRLADRNAIVLIEPENEREAVSFLDRNRDHFIDVKACFLVLLLLGGSGERALQDAPALASFARSASFDVTPAPRVDRTPTAIEETQLEGNYRTLGWYKGPLGARDVQDRGRAFWRSAGAEGAAWLLRRIRDEHSVDVLAAVAEIVGDIGRAEPAGMKACLDVLNGDPSEEQQDAALTALRWMAVPAAEPLVVALRATIERYLHHAEPEFQEKAVLATRALPIREAEALLAAVRDGLDDATQRVIDEERVRRRRRS